MTYRRELVCAEQASAYILDADVFVATTTTTTAVVVVIVVDLFISSSLVCEGISVAVFAHCIQPAQTHTQYPTDIPVP